MQLTNTPGKLVLPFANAGAKNTIPTASQIGITAGAASLTDGFPPLTRMPIAAGGVPPSGLDMNGILYELSAILRWANAGGGYAYDAAFATDSNVNGYPKGARIMRSDGLGYWFNTVENNTTDPEAAGAAAAGWVPDFTNGVTAVTMTSANVTLTPLQYGKPIIVITGTLTANLNLIFPAIVNEWTVINNTTGAFTITCKTASGTGIVVKASTKIVCNGVNIDYSVKDSPFVLVAEAFGASVNAADNTAAIQAAISYALGLGNCRLTFAGKGVYTCLAPLGSFSGSNLEIDLCGSTLNFSALSLASTGPLLEFAGTYGATAALTSNAAERVKTIAVVSAAFVTGDMVRLYSDTVFDSTRTGTKYGELSFVESVPNGASVALTTETQASYTTAASATLQKITPVKNITIRNGTILGPSGNDELIGIRIKAGVSCLIENIKSYDVDKVHVSLEDCIFSKVRNCHFEQADHSAQAYGISFADACQDCSAIGNSFVDVRHSMTTNNNVGTSWGVTRRILFEANNVSDSAKATGGTGGDAIDTHAGAEDILILGNTVNSASGNGINVEARTAIVIGNVIVNAATLGIYVQPFADSLPSAFTVEGNTLYNVGSAASEYGIQIFIRTADCSAAVVNGNRISSYAQPIRLVCDSPYVFKKAAVSGNVAAVADGVATQNGIDVTRANRATVNGNSVKAGAVGIILTDCNNFSVTGNSVEITNSSGSSGYGIRVRGTSDHGAVCGNSALYSSSGITTTIGVSFAQTTVTNSGVWCNTMQGFGTNVNVGTGAGNAAANNI